MSLRSSFIEDGYDIFKFEKRLRKDKAILINSFVCLFLVRGGIAVDGVVFWRLMRTSPSY